MPFLYKADKGRLVLKGGAIYYPDEIHHALGIKPFARYAQLKPPPKAAPTAEVGGKLP